MFVFINVGFNLEGIFQHATLGWNDAMALASVLLVKLYVSATL